ncbi:septation protein SepH [Arthrobacter sp. Sr24]
MADLRLVGVHDDGEHLLLSGPDGDNYLLPLDEALRTAVGRTSQRAPRLNQPGARMTPREIQSLIRAGSSATDVADQSGLSLEQVRRYEGPVLAEREYIASQARKVHVASSALPSANTKPSLDEEPTTLEEMVRFRLSAFGIDRASLRWDAWRDHAGAWTISADFEPGTEWAASSIGEPAPALWRFHAGRKSLQNANRWAQQLSELEPLDSPVPERRLTAVADKPFDVDADGTSTSTSTSTENSTAETVDFGDGDSSPAEAATTDPADTTGESAGTASGTEPDAGYAGHGLLDMLRSRRGVRLGINEAGDDELAAMLGTHVPGAHPRDETLYGQDTDHSNAGDPEPAPAPESGSKPESARDRLRKLPFLQLAPRLADDALDSVAEVSTETREVVLSGEPTGRLQQVQKAATPADAASTPTALAQNPSALKADTEDPGPSDSEVAARLERKAAAKPKRSSVPSWDEIVFGTKGD